jgi:hypothetical protein
MGFTLEEQLDLVATAEAAAVAALDSMQAKLGGKPNAQAALVLAGISLGSACIKQANKRWPNIV